jgi:redox-sensitive bicupin YhaK (pirin superfamily)
MHIVRRASKRRRTHRAGRQVWRTFRVRPDLDGSSDGFGALRVLDESTLAPGLATTCRRVRDVEVLTYVHEGALSYEDTLGRCGVIGAGEFERMTVGPTLGNCEANASRTDRARVFQIGLRRVRTELVEPSRVQRRFSAAQRRSELCVIASPDGRRGSLRIAPEALVCSAILYDGQHLVHELPAGRAAWVHVVLGEVALGGATLSVGDSAAITGERSVSLTARAPSEILLLELEEPPTSRPAVES